MDYADNLLLESRNDTSHSDEYTEKGWCPNSLTLEYTEKYWSRDLYEAKTRKKIPECPSGQNGGNGDVEMIIKEVGIWTIEKCPLCGWSHAESC